RPGDAAEVRHLGVAKWIDLQLHPDRIVENPLLHAKLATLTTLSLPMWAILTKYPAANPALVYRPPSSMALGALAAQQNSRIMNGSLQERQNTLAELDPSVRRLVL